jgi:hypothetical protein
MTRVELPAGISLVGVIWGKKAPLWIERDSFGVESLHSLAGEVSAWAHAVVEYLPGTPRDDVTRTLWRLRFMGYRNIDSRQLSIDYQI